jgi:hypothetical protein
VQALVCSNDYGPVIAAVHEHMHQGPGREQQPGQRAKEVRGVLGDQEKPPTPRKPRVTWPTGDSHHDRGLSARLPASFVPLDCGAGAPSRHPPQFSGRPADEGTIGGEDFCRLA